MRNVYIDEDGRVILIGQCEDTSHAFMRVTDGDAVAEACVAAENVPAFAAALYEAARIPAPLVLERPGPRDVLVPSTAAGESWVTVTASPDPDPAARAETLHGRPLHGVMLAVDGSAIRLIGDEPLRVAAALVDAWTGTGAEPDPDEAEELTAFIRRLSNGTQIDDLARAIVRAGWRRDEQQRGEGDRHA